MDSRCWIKGAVSAVAGAGLAIAPAAVSLSADAAAVPAPAWHLSRTVPANEELEGIAAPARDQAWAYGFTEGSHGHAFYLRWNGRVWKRARIRPVPRGFVPEQIRASSAANVWILGEVGTKGDVALVYNGHTWRAIATPTTEDPSELDVASSTDAWLVTANGATPSGTTTIEHWTGGGWKRYSFTGDLALAGGGANPWLVGKIAYPGTVLAEVLHWALGTWFYQPTPDRSPAQIVGVATPSGKLCWLAVRSRKSGPWRLYQLRDSSWSSFRVPRALHFHPAAAGGPVSDGHNGFWAPPLHWTGTRWVVTARTQPNRPSWLNSFWYNNVAPVPGSSGTWAIVLANSSSPAGVLSGIAYYGSRP